MEGRLMAAEIIDGKLLAQNLRAVGHDERWLMKRQIDIYNKGVDAFREEYSAENDKTRNRSDENIRNYNKMVVADDAYSKKYTTE